MPMKRALLSLLVALTLGGCLVRPAGAYGYRHDRGREYDRERERDRQHSEREREEHQDRR
jgi:hypothetical protein